MVEPRVSWVPPAVDSRARAALEIAAAAKLPMDDWQQHVLEGALGVQADGRWAAFEVGLVVSRQNGKGGILEARELAGVTEFGERLLIHSAHQFDTSMEAFLRMENLIEEAGLVGELRKRGGVSRSHGAEGFSFRNGARLRYRTRTKGGGRGFSADLIVLDEAMILQESSLAALLPTLSARENPQVWYTGSAVDQQVHEHGVVLARVRQRGTAGGEKAGRLAYYEWSPDIASPELVDQDVARDLRVWRQANPALGIRVTEDAVENERLSLDPRSFAVERLGVGDWPPTDGSNKGIIDMGLWGRLIDVHSTPADGLCFAFDVSPARTHSSIVVAARRADGLGHLEVVDHHPGTGWVVPRLAELREKYQPTFLGCDGGSPAASLVDELAGLFVRVDLLTGPEVGRACGRFLDAVVQERVRHLGTTELRTAVRVAKTAPLGDSWRWARTRSSADITPLVAATVAWAGVENAKPSVYRTRGVVTV